VAGQATAFTVIAQDENNNTVTDYTGTIQFNTLDGLATFPAPYTFTIGDQGVHVFEATWATAGLQAVRVVDVSSLDLHGSTGGVLVAAGALHHFDFVAPHSVKAGQLFRVAAIPKDEFGNTIWNYTGSVNIASSDGDYDYRHHVTFGPQNRGHETFGVILWTPGHQQIRLTNDGDADFYGSFRVRVAPGEFAGLSVTNALNTVAGEETELTVTAIDSFGNPITDFTGTVYFHSSDPNAILPESYTFTGAEQGSKTFTAILKTAGQHAIRVSDGVEGNGMFGAGQFTVAAAALDHFVVVAPANAVAGRPFDVTVTAMDEFGNVVTDYTGTINLNATDLPDAPPVPFTFEPGDNGVHTFTVTLNAEGLQGLRVADSSNSELRGGIAVMVNPGRVGRTASLPEFSVKTAPEPKAHVSRPSTAAQRPVADVTPTDDASVQPVVLQTGSHVINATSDGTFTFDLILNTPGEQSITVTSVENPRITAVTRLTVAGPEEKTAVASVNPSTVVMATAIRPGDNDHKPVQGRSLSRPDRVTLKRVARPNNDGTGVATVV
jgi:hypothetical protein